MDHYKCEVCGEVFDEFGVNYFLVQVDKERLCEKCRIKSSLIKPILNYNYTPGVGHYKNCPVCIGECVCP